MNISVIIPVKNRAALLRITLDCILNQSKKPHEIIVVDDGSTDELPEVINEYKDRVIFTKSAGKGPGAARNTGMRLATGNAIQFFDSDDLMTVNKLEVQARLLEEQNADFVYGPWVKAVNEEGTWKQVDVIMQYHPLEHGNFADYVLQGWCNITQTVLFKRELFDKVGFWREDLMPHEDYEFWFRVGKQTQKFVHENKSCVIYRQHKHQITDMDVPNKARWMDGINAMKYIQDGINYNASMSSLWSFKGRAAASKAEFIKKFGNDPAIHLGLLDNAYVFFHKLIKKLTRVKGTNWQHMHGISKSADAFKNYLKLLKV